MKIVIFILLKVIEISSVIFIPYGIGLLFREWEWYCVSFNLANTPTWIIGIFTLFFLAAILFLLIVSAVIVVEVFKKNLEWANRIRGRE